MGQCWSKTTSAQEPVVPESDAKPDGYGLASDEDPSDLIFKELSERIDRKLREDAEVSDSVKKGISVVQSVTPIVLEYVGMALDKLGEAHWTLTALRFVGTAMKMWTVATKNQSSNFDLYGKLKDFYDTLQRSAVQFSDKVKSDATCVVLKAMHSSGSLQTEVLFSSLSGVDEQSLKVFADELEKSRTTLAFEGIFLILDVLDKQREMEMAKYQVELQKEYETLQTHLDTIYAFRDKHGKSAYYLMWMEGLQRKTKEAESVDKARRALNTYWKGVKSSYELGTLPVPGKEFLTGHMLRKGVDYRNLAEPLDCANWKLGDYYSAQQRPGAYKLICKRQEAAGSVAHDLVPSGEAWEMSLVEISTKCREARDKQTLGKKGCIVM
ncbi:g5740 [Coccomyxa elongata]